MISRVERISNYTILTFFALAVLLPLTVLVFTALSSKSNGEPTLANPQWINFVQAWNQASFGSHLLTSATVCAIVVAATLVLTPAAAFGIAILKAPGKAWIFPLFLAGIMIPLEGIIVPLYFTFRSYGLTGGIGGLMIAHVGLAVSFGVFWMRAAFAAVPASLLESAKLDGAGNLRSYWSVCLPIVRPAVITLALLTFMWTWNDYFLAFVLVNDPSQLPVTVALGSFSTKHATQVNLLAAAAVLIAVPVVAVYIFFQRYFIQGILSGAVKG